MLLAYYTNSWTMNSSPGSVLYNKLDDLLHTCRFGGVACNETDFIAIRDPTYGYCYQFNNVLPPKYMQARAGNSFGIVIIILCSLHNYRFVSTVESI